MNTIFQKNLESIRKNNPDLAEILGKYNVRPGKYQLLQSSSGKLTLKANNQFIHSGHDPQIEAEKMIKSYKQLGESDLVILIGFGLGYLLAEIIKNTGTGCEIMVFEKSLDLFLLALQNIDFSGQLNERKIHFIVSEIMPDQDLTGYSKITIVEHKPSVISDGDGYYEKIKQGLTNKLKEQLTDLTTAGYFGPIWHRNIILNLASLYRSDSLKNYRNSFEKKPGVLIAPGPSLDETIDLLPQNAVKLCLLPALELLGKKNIKPDFVAGVDGNYYNSWHIKNINSENLTLISEPSVCSQMIRHWKGKIIWADFDLPPEQNLGLDLGKLQMSGTVAAFALQILLYFGCDPIIFAGQDFAIIDTLSHCKGNLAEKIAARNQDKFNNAEMINKNYLKNEKLIRINEKTYTTNKLSLYREWFEKKIKEESRSKEFINTSRDGAKIKGTRLSRIQDLKFGGKIDVSNKFHQMGNSVYGKINMSLSEIIKKLEYYIGEIDNQKPEGFINNINTDGEIANLLSMELLPQFLKFKKDNKYLPLLSAIKPVLSKLKFRYQIALDKCASYANRS